MREGAPPNVVQAWKEGDEETLRKLGSAGGKAAAKKRAEQKMLEAAHTEALEIEKMRNEATKEKGEVFSEHEGDIMPPLQTS